LTIGISAYLEVRDDKFDTNWLLLDYESDKSDKLKLTQVGTGGLTELREALDDSKASYAYVRITYANDKESTRQKFILVVRHPFFIRDSQAQQSVMFQSAGLDWSALQSYEESQGENLARYMISAWSLCGSHRDPR
jgi:hypothetical protein